MGYLDCLYGHDWELTKSPAGAHQWTPKKNGQEIKMKNKDLVIFFIFYAFPKSGLTIVKSNPTIFDIFSTCSS